MRILKSSLLFLVLFFGFSLGFICSTESEAIEKPSGTELIKSKFSLVDHLGNAVTEKTFYGEYTLIFFGFSHCSTICPVGLHTMVSVVNQLAEEVEVKIIPLFITIDPERDDVARMAEFVAFFDEKLIGLTGSAEATGAAAESFRAYYGKIKGDTPDSYSFDHSSLIYLMDTKGKYLQHFSSPQGVEKIVGRIKKILNEVNKETKKPKKEKLNEKI